MIDILKGDFSIEPEAHKNLEQTIWAGMAGNLQGVDTEDPPGVYPFEKYDVLKIEGMLFKGERAATQLRRWGVRAASYQEIVATIRGAHKPVVLLINSPGGAVQGLLKCMRDLYAMRGAVSAVQVHEACLSAAYFMAAATGAPIMASSDDDYIGAVGTMTTTTKFDFEHSHTDKHATAKMPDTAEGKKAMTALLTSLADPMYSIVEAARGIDPRALHGAIFNATDAVEKKLIDGIDTFEGMYDILDQD